MCLLSNFSMYVIINLHFILKNRLKLLKLLTHYFKTNLNLFRQGYFTVVFKQFKYSHLFSDIITQNKTQIKNIK